MARMNSSRNRCLWISIPLILIALAIALPVVILLPKNARKDNYQSAQTSNILLPLYIYPNGNATWNPLFQVVEARPQLKFTVIINPQSGPGPSQYPADQYAAQLQRLNSYANVDTVGYVRTGYATRNISDVVSEIDRYAGWASKSNGLAIHGIFFDESPHEYSAPAVEFMRNVNEVAKNSNGLQGNKTVIHNPGVIPDPAYNDTNTDITVVFEDSYPAYQVALASLTALPKHRSEYSFMINDVPIMDLVSLQKFVGQLSDLAEYLFLTDLSVNYYESFGSIWTNFTNSVPV